jgi:5,6,7,8-tetrahydromethanopterin hydro-lyase
MSMQLGEAFAGEGPEAAHVNTVFGTRNGPVGTAWATALATPRTGHVPFVAVLRPGLPVQPMTLFVNKAAIASERHGVLTWGAAQAGVAGGVADAVADDALDGHGGIDDQCLIVAVWVDPGAEDEELVYANNRAATFQAIHAGARHLPRLADVLTARQAPANPYFRRS